MQMLAGIITEGQYKETIETENSTPENAADIVVSNLSKIENSPEIKNIADKIAKDPKATKELMMLLSKANISLNENLDIDPSDAKKIALVFAKKAETLNEDGDVGGAFWLGLIGGGTLAHYLYSITTYDLAGLAQHSAAMVPTILGAIAGAVLLTIAKHIYNSSTGNN
jgi:hypothetical protein